MEEKEKHRLPVMAAQHRGTHVDCDVDENRSTDMDRDFHIDSHSLRRRLHGRKMDRC